MEFLGNLMELSHIPYPTLASFRKTGQLDIHKLKFICKEVVSAIMHIHGKGILHNGIKGDNVIVAGDRIVLIDFGKATMIKCPVQYNITPGSEEQST